MTARASPDKGMRGRNQFSPTLMIAIGSVRFISDANNQNPVRLEIGEFLNSRAGYEFLIDFSVFFLFNRNSGN